METGQHPGEVWAGWSCPEQVVLVPAGCRNSPGHRVNPLGSLSGEEHCGKWVIDLDNSTDRLVRSGSGAGGRASRQVEPCNLHPACDLAETHECLAMAGAWLLSGMWASGMWLEAAERFCWL